MSANREILKDALVGRYGATQIDEKEIEKVTEVLSKKELFRYDTVCSKTDLLEKSLCEFYGKEYALALCNGSAALKAALVALEVKAGDEVLVTPYTFIATVNSIISIGAVPVFVDIDETLSLNLKDAERKMSDKTKAMITVHIQGDGTDVQSEKAFCEKYNIVLIEDCAQAFGSKVKGEFVGSAGSIGCFSLQANKLVTCGEGGFLLTSSQGYYQKARNFQDQGGNREVDSFANWDNPMALFGENLKITELQSAVALAQVEKANGFIQKLRNNRKKIQDSLGNHTKGYRIRKCVDALGSNGVAIPFIADTAEERKRIVDYLEANDVPVICLYDELIYEFELYQNGKDHWKASSADCKVAEDLKTRMFWVLNSLNYTENEVEYIIKVLKEIN